MDGQRVGVTATEITLSAEGLDAGTRVSAARAWIWAMARNEGVALPDALFHHQGGEAPAEHKPTILWRPARGGVRIIAVGGASQSVLLQALEPLVGLLTRATHRRVGISVDPMKPVSAVARGGVRRSYHAVNVVVAKRDSAWARWNAMNGDARKDFMVALLERHLSLLANAWGVDEPIGGWQVRVQEIVEGDGSNAVLTRGIGRHGKTIYGLRLDRVRFSSSVHLEGPWCVGHGASKGWGRILPARVARARHE